MASDDAIYHHLIPQTYMKPWCFSGNSIWVYDKSSQKSKPHNIENICGINYFHSIRAGSLYASQDSLNKIWSFLLPYHISINGKALDTTGDMNRHYSEFDHWEIKYPNGAKVNKKNRNIIKQRIKQSKVNDIEEQWNVQFENDWRETSQLLYEKIQKIQEGEPIFLTAHDSSTIMKYIIMFDWRGAIGNEQLNELLEFIDNQIFSFSEIDIPQNDRTYQSDKTALDEIRHAYLLKTYDEFLSGSGTMQKALESYEENLTFIFMLTSSGDKFITSNNPSFMFKNAEGYNEHVFVALPSLLISLAKKDKEHPHAYKIAYLETEQVKQYNQVIFENASMILSSEQLVP